MALSGGGANRPTKTSVRWLSKRVPWDPPRLLAAAVALGVIWLASLLVGPATKGQSVLCDVGGPCTAVYARDAFAATGAVAGMFALIVLAVAGLRRLRTRPRRD